METVQTEISDRIAHRDGKIFFRHFIHMSIDRPINKTQNQVDYYLWSMGDQEIRDCL